MFTSIPTQFDSLNSPLLYTYESDVPQSITFTILESQTEEILGVKKFNSTTVADLNIAPIVKPYAIHTPTSEMIGFVEDNRQGTVEVQVVAEASDSDDEVSSELRRFTLSDYCECVEGIITTMPDVRFMSIGESELLTFNVNPDASLYITVDQYVYGWTSHSGLSDEEIAASSSEAIEVPLVTRSYLLESTDNPFVRFNVTAEPFEEQLDFISELDLEKIVVCATQITSTTNDDGEEVTTEVELANITYHIIDEPLNPKRLAWISQRGTVEHYTFPLIKMIKRAAGVTSLSLLSAPEPTNMRQALQEIIDSPRLWMVEEGEYREVTLLNDSIDVNFTTMLDSLEIDICYYD